MSTATAPAENPLAVLKAPGALKDKPKQFKAAIDAWVKVQPPWVEAASTGLFGSVQGAFLGTLMGTMAQSGMGDGAAAAGPGAQMMKMGGPFQQARNFAVMTGVNAALSAYMKRVRNGVEDVQNTMIAGFGSGFCFSLVSGMGGNTTPAMPGGTPNPLMGAFSAGVVFALFQGGFYKLGEAFGGPKTVETDYARVKAMLHALGMPQYEKNLKKAMMNDATIMLWDGPSLTEAKVPAGHRLLILAHIDQYRGKVPRRSGDMTDILRPALPVGSSK